MPASPPPGESVAIPSAETATSGPSVTPTAPSPTTALTGSTVGGWYAGASGLGVASGKYAKWLKQPVTFAGSWADQDDYAQRTLPTLSKEFRSWKGGLDLAVGGTVLGSKENYAAAAKGAYDERWKEAARTLAASRKGAWGPTFVRPFHEMNGNWYDNWVVTKKNSADFKKAFARYTGILRKAMPTVYISWSPNFGDHTGINVDYWYPGDAVVDCVAPDYYDDGASPGRLNVDAWNTEADDHDGNRNPTGPEAWRQFAEKHGKPVCFPEWGLKPEGEGVDHPEWIRAMNIWMNKHANIATWTLGQPIPEEASGKVLYSVYFNVLHQDKPGFTIYGAKANPKSAALFPKLRWGNRS